MVIWGKDTKELVRSFLLLKTEADAKKFLRDLLTDAEIKEFANRWKVVRLLDKKVSYESITKQTGMSSTTIARIQKWLHGKVGGYKNMLQKIKEANKAASPKGISYKAAAHHAPLSAA